jgi:hypothetical protein
MNEPLIAREEIVALLVNVSDIVAILSRIERLLFEDDDGEKTRTKAEHEEFERHQKRVLANAQRTRELAERAQAKLDAQASRD